MALVIIYPFLLLGCQVLYDLLDLSLILLCILVVDATFNLEHFLCLMLNTVLSGWYILSCSVFHEQN